MKEIVWWIAWQQALRGALAAEREQRWEVATTSLEFEYLLRKIGCEMLIGGDDISNDVITRGTCFPMFVYIRARFRFALVGGNLAVQLTGSLGNWRWNSNSRDVVASSPSFSRPASRAPRKACSQAVWWNISATYFLVMITPWVISLKLWKFVDSSPLNSSHQIPN